MCYQERYQKSIVNATTCRPSLKSCQNLEYKLEVGTRTLIAGSTSISCQKYKANTPWKLFGTRKQWLRSSVKGSWWSPKGCLLNNVKSIKPKRPSRKNQKTRTKTSTKKNKKKSSAYSTKNSFASNSCQSTCQAHLMNEKERKKRFQQTSVPQELRWGKAFAKRAQVTINTCVARKLGQGRDPLRGNLCTNEGVEVCVKYCKQAQ